MIMPTTDGVSEVPVEQLENSEQSEQSEQDSEAPTESLHRVDADILIPGRGEPVRDASLIYEGSKIVYAGGRAGLLPKWSGLEAVKVKVLMPGMWDW